MKIHSFAQAAVVAASVLFFAAPVFAQDDPVGVPMGEVQYGDPDAGQGYTSGDATNSGAGTEAYLGAENAAIDSDSAATEFDGTDPYQGTDSFEGNIGTVAEPNE